MKKNVLSEVNRYREIIGLNPIVEQKPTLGSKEKVKVGSKSTTNTLNIPMQRETFEKGKYKFNSLTEEGKKGIDETLKKVSTFISQNKNSKVTINIEVGESQVTNYDRERCRPKDYSSSCKLETGELARLRAETIVKYLKSQFGKLKTRGEITNVPVFPTPKTNVELGTQKHQYTKGKDKPDDPKYKEDQYVKFNINIESTTTENIYDERCLVNFVVDVSYHKKRHSKFGCRGGHYCNQAKFDIYLNEVKLGVANLNNKEDGGDREAIFTVTSDMVDDIMKGDTYKLNKTLTLWSRCLHSNCHNSTQEVKLSNSKGEVLYHECVNPTGKDSKRGAKDRILAIMDECGNVKEDYDYKASREEIEALTDFAKQKTKFEKFADDPEYVAAIEKENQEFEKLVRSGETKIEFKQKYLTDIISGKSDIKITNMSLDKNNNFVVTVKNTSGQEVYTQLSTSGDKYEKYREAKVYGLSPEEELKTVVNRDVIEVREQYKDTFYNRIKKYEVQEKNTCIIVPEDVINGEYLYFKKQSAINYSYGILPNNKKLQGRSVYEPNTLVLVKYLTKKEYRDRSKKRI